MSGVNIGGPKCNDGITLADGTRLIYYDIAALNKYDLGVIGFKTFQIKVADIDEKDFDYLSLNEALDETIRKYDSYLEKLKHYQIGDVNDKFYQEIVKVMNRGEKDESD